MAKKSVRAIKTDKNLIKRLGFNSEQALRNYLRRKGNLLTQMILLLDVAVLDKYEPGHTKEHQDRLKKIRAVAHEISAHFKKVKMPALTILIMKPKILAAVAILQFIS